MKIIKISEALFYGNVTASFKSVLNVTSSFLQALELRVMSHKFQCCMTLRTVTILLHLYLNFINMNIFTKILKIQNIWKQEI